MSDVVKVEKIHRRGYMIKNKKEPQPLGKILMSMDVHSLRDLGVPPKRESADRINEEIIDLISERLAVGAKKYGEEILVTDKRDFVQETLEEILDSCVYLACKIIQLKALIIQLKAFDLLSSSKDAKRRQV